MATAATSFQLRKQRSQCMQGLGLARILNNAAYKQQPYHSFHVAMELTACVTYCQAFGPVLGRYKKRQHAIPCSTRGISKALTSTFPESQPSNCPENQDRLNATESLPSIHHCRPSTSGYQQSPRSQLAIGRPASQLQALGLSSASIPTAYQPSPRSQLAIGRPASQLQALGLSSASIPTAYQPSPRSQLAIGRQASQLQALGLSSASIPTAYQPSPRSQ